MRKIGVCLVVLGLACLTTPAQADLVLEVTAGSGQDSVIPGQFLTTPAGGPWHKLTFNWFSDSPGTTPRASGDLFLYAQEYLGTPDNMGSGTTGFLAQSSGIAGGKYLFNELVTLQPNTMYFFYANDYVSLTGGANLPGAGAFGTGTLQFPFGSSSFDWNFRLEGTVVPAPIPEPTTLALFGLGLAGLIAWRRKRRKAA